MNLEELKRKIQEENPMFTNELLDLLLEYIRKKLENKFIDDAKKIGINS